jgi:hypothetical protein
MTQQVPPLGIVLDATTSTDPALLAAQARRAEALGVDFVLLDEPPGAPAGGTGRIGFDPLDAAAFVGAVTQSIGVVATAPATYAEPYHLANRISSLDWGSHGRTGWLATVDTSAERGNAYGVYGAYGVTALDAASARREADAVIDAVRRLWDSWEDGALIADESTGRFLDSDRLHYVDVDTEFFRVRGPGLMPRPPQGHPLVLGLAADRLAQVDSVLTEGGEPVAAGAIADIRLSPDEPFDLLLGTLVVGYAGVLLRPWSTDAALEALAAALPALQAGGLRHTATGATLRERFGLSRPASRYETAQTA